jgi:hypothetical protein
MSFVMVLAFMLVIGHHHAMSNAMSMAGQHAESLDMAMDIEGSLTLGV